MPGCWIAWIKQKQQLKVTWPWDKHTALLFWESACLSIFPFLVVPCCKEWLNVISVKAVFNWTLILRTFLYHFDHCNRQHGGQSQFPHVLSLSRHHHQALQKRYRRALAATHSQPYHSEYTGIWCTFCFLEKSNHSVSWFGFLTR